MKKIISLLCLFFTLSSIHPMERPANNGRTPLMEAARNGHAHLIANLIQREGVRAVDYDGWTALMYAAYWNQPAIVNQLLAAGANPDVQARDRSTALMDAACNWSINNECARLLIGAGANLNLADESGWTALMYGARSINSNTLSQLIHAGAHLNAQNNWSQTALMIAIERGNFENVRALTQAGANLRQRDWLWRTASSYAEHWDRAHNNAQHRMVDILSLNPLRRPGQIADQPTQRAFPAQAHTQRVDAGTQASSASHWSVAQPFLAIGTISGIAYIVYHEFFKQKEVPKNIKPIKGRPSKTKVSWKDRLNNLSIESKVAAALSTLTGSAFAYLTLRKIIAQQPVHQVPTVEIQPQVIAREVAPAVQPEVIIEQPEVAIAQPVEQQDAPIAQAQEMLPAANPALSADQEAIAPNQVLRADDAHAQAYDYEEEVNRYYGVGNEEDSSSDEYENESLWDSISARISRIIHPSNALANEELLSDQNQDNQPRRAIQPQSPRHVILEMGEELAEEDRQELIPDEREQIQIAQEQHVPRDVVVDFSNA